MRNRRDRVFETTIYTKESDYPETEYFRLLGDLGGVSVSDALRRSVFAIHPDTKDYTITSLTGKDLAKEKAGTELNNLVRNVIADIALDGDNQTSGRLVIRMSNYDFLRRMQDPEDPYFKVYREVCGEEELSKLKERTIRNMMSQSMVTTMHAILGRNALFANRELFSNY